MFLILSLKLKKMQAEEEKTKPKLNFLETAEAILESYRSIKFMLPEAERPHIEKISEDLKLVTEHYCALLYDSSAFSQKLVRDIDSLRKELNEERAKTASYEKEIMEFRQTTAANINKRQFSFYVMSAKDRPPTEQEWLNFNETFTFDYRPINAKVYEWIDNNITNSPKIEIATRIS